MEWIGTMKATGFQWCNEGNWKLIQNTGTRAFTVAFQITRSPSCSSSVSTGFFFLCLSYRLSLPATAGTGTCSLAVLLDRPWNFTENDRFDFVFFSLPFHYFHFICLTAAFMDISADGRVVFFLISIWGLCELIFLAYGGRVLWLVARFFSYLIPLISLFELVKPTVVQRFRIFFHGAASPRRGIQLKTITARKYLSLGRPANVMNHEDTVHRYEIQFPFQVRCGRFDLMNLARGCSGITLIWSILRNW